MIFLLKKKSFLIVILVILYRCIIDGFVASTGLQHVSLLPTAVKRVVLSLVSSPTSIYIFKLSVVNDSLPG